MKHPLPWKHLVLALAFIGACARNNSASNKTDTNTNTQTRTAGSGGSGGGQGSGGSTICTTARR